MNNQTIIELREQDNTATNIDVANWENTLNQPLVLRQGDSLSLKGAFIDSVAQNSGRIIVEPDDPNAPEGSTDRENATIGISFCHYFHDWGTSKGNLDDRAYTPADQKYTSGRDYVLTDKISLGGATLTEVNAITMENGTFPVAFPLGQNIEDPVRFFFHYLNQSGKETKLQFSFDLKTMKKVLPYTGYGKDGNKDFFTINQHVLDTNPHLLKTGNLKFPFIAVKNGMDGGTKTLAPDTSVNFPTTGGKKPLVLNGSDFMNFEFMGFTSAGTSDIANTDGDLFQPRIHDYNFKIPARDYAPDELARELSKQLTRTEQEIYIEDQFAVVDNPILTTSRSLQVIGDAVVDNTNLPHGFTPITAGNPNVPPTFCRDDGKALSNFITDSDNYLVGSSQFAVEFNENVGAEGIFQITSIHTPILDGSGRELNKCIDLGVKAEADNKRVKFIANKNGGVLLTDVRPRSLWEGQMKFNTNNLLTKFTMNAPQDFGGLSKVRTVSFDVVDGVNATGQLKSIDVPVNKNTSFDLVQAYPFDVVSPLKMIVDAEDSLDGDTALDSGYYLIELTSNFFTEKVAGDQTKRNIMGIVSRFYQQDSFTSSIDGEGTFEYIHTGSDIQISKIGCRILNPDHQLAQNLKDNNTIFLQLNRAEN